MTGAEIACLVRVLGLSQADLAEIGGVTDRQARRWMTGISPVPADVVEALGLIHDDIETLTSAMIADVEEGEAVIWTYRSTADLRAALPEIPGRGKAAGAFVGPHQIAAITAQDSLDVEQGIEAEIRFG